MGYPLDSGNRPSAGLVGRFSLGGSPGPHGMPRPAAGSSLVEGRSLPSGRPRRVRPALHEGLDSCPPKLVMIGRLVTADAVGATLVRNALVVGRYSTNCHDSSAKLRLRGKTMMACGVDARSPGVPGTVLRMAKNVGSGSASFEIFAMRIAQIYRH